MEQSLLMADGNNNRVLLWDDLPTSNTEQQLSLDSKQCHFDTNNSGESENRTQMVADVATLPVEESTFIADTYNHRILIWNELPSTNASSPDLILTSTEYDDPRCDTECQSVCWWPCMVYGPMVRNYLLVIFDSRVHQAVLPMVTSDLEDGS